MAISTVAPSVSHDADEGQMGRFGGRLIRGTALNMIAVGFNQGSTLIVNIIVARILMKHAFGEYAMVYSTLLVVAFLAQLSTGYTVSKYIAEYRSRDPERAGRIMGMSAIVSALTAVVGTILLVAAAPWLAGTMLKAPHLAHALIIGAGFILFSAINGYQTGALSGLEAYGSLARAGVASGIVAVAVVSMGAWWGGLNGAFAGLSLSACIRCAIHNRWLRLENRAQGITLRYRGSLRQEKAIVFNFAFPAAIAGYYSMPMIWLANSFLVREPGGYGEMALYSAATNLRILVLFLPNVMNTVGRSVLNYEKAKGDVVHYHRVFRSNVIHILLITLAGVLVVGVFGRPILQLFGKEFRAGYVLLWLLLISGLFDGMGIALHQYVQCEARIWLALFSVNLPRETFLVTASYFLVQPYGGVGLAVAYLGSTILGFIAHCILVAMLYREN